jgi:DNA replication protein DnaC
MNENFDASRLTLLLSELRLPATKQMWPVFAEQSDKEGWPAARLLTVLAENELAERDRRRIERHLAEAKLLPGKTLDNFDFNAVPMVSKAQVMALCAGDEWLRNGSNALVVGYRSGLAGEGVAGAVRTHVRPRSAFAGGAPRAGTGSGAHPA